MTIAAGTRFGRYEIHSKIGEGRMREVYLDSGPRKQLTNFKSDLIFYYAWSRDGKKLDLAQGRKPSDVVLIRDSGEQ